MATETSPHPIKSLANQIGQYLETRIDLVKLKTVDKSADVVGTVFMSVVLVSGLFLFLFFLSIGFSLYLGKLLRNNYHGFFIVAGLYLIVTLILFALRKKWIKMPFVDMIIQNVLK